MILSAIPTAVPLFLMVTAQKPPGQTRFRQAEFNEADGVYRDASGVERDGREEIAAHVRLVSRNLGDPTERIGDAAENDDGSFVASMRATYRGFTVEQPIVLTFDGEMIARMVWSEPWL